MSFFDTLIAQLEDGEGSKPSEVLIEESVPEMEASSEEVPEPLSSVSDNSDDGDDNDNNSNDDPPVPFNPNSLRTIATSSYLNYAMSVITSRALPDVRDGMKPGQRRILYAMYEDFKLTYDKQHRKSAAITGTVIGRYHPHGDSASYEAMVRMSQDWVMRIPLVDGHGNFGSIDGDKAAAARYTEVRLAPVFHHLMPDLKKDTVLFRPNYDNTTTEPSVLPVTLPLLLINGATGIAVGMATNIPPHNPGEVIDAAIDLIKNPSRQVDTLVKNHLKGPDFPTGGMILEDEKKIAAIYSNGTGSVTVRAKWHVEKEGRKASIVITEIPYGVIKQDLVEKIAKYIVGNELPLVNDIRDESTKDIRIVLEIKSAKDEHAVMAFLLKHTALESKFHINLTSLVPEVNDDSKVIPKRLDLKEMLQHFVDFRKEVVIRRTKYDIKELGKRIHVLKGFVIVLGDTEKAVKLIMAAKSKDEAREALLQNFPVDTEQAENVLNARIYRLANYEIQTLKDELVEKEKQVSDLEALLQDENALKEVLIKELREMRKLYATPRLTTIGEDAIDFEYDEADYIEDADVVVVLSRGGWFRRQKSYSSIEGLRVRDGDEIGWVIKANTKDLITFFTNKGKAYTARVHQLPETTGFGDPIQSMFSFDDGEKVLSCWTFKEGSANLELVAVSTNGYALRFDLDKFLEPSTTNGRAFIKLDKNQDVVGIEKIEGEDPHVVIVSYDTRCLSFDPLTISKYKGVARGVKAMTLNLKDYVLAFGITSGARGGSLTVETGQEAKYEIRHTTYKVGRRGQLGIEILKRGKFVKWNKEAVEV